MTEITPYPTKEKFEKDCAKEDKKKEKDEYENPKMWLYSDHARPSTANNLMTDYTSESHFEDERTWANGQNPGELWDRLLPDAKKWLIETMRSKVPMEIVEKYCSKELLKEFKRLKEFELLNKI